MNKVNIKIWGRKFKLLVNYKIVEKDTMTKMQQESLDLFMKNTNLINEVKKNVDEYVINHVASNISEVDNIFKYVKPKCVYIPNEKNVFAIMCNYKFDMEHGMAIVFENGKFKEIGAEDIVL
ncbi:MAG: hypothetical protein K6G88_06180 [Lachnospiraceae bacterium]|nr:hypothetical protein [Lachnospiraceae bacterium]